MNWKDVIKNKAGRKNKDDFKEYGAATPMPKSAKETRDKNLAPKKPLTEQEELRREQKKLSRRKKFEAKRDAKLKEGKK